MKFKKLKHEKSYPWIVGLAAFGGGLFLPEWCIRRIAHELLNPAISVAAIGVGFIGALIAIVATAVDNEALARLRTSDRHKTLKDYARHAVYLAFGISVYSALLLLFATHEWARFARIPIALWVGLATATVCASYRVIDILFELM